VQRGNGPQVGRLQYLMTAPLRDADRFGDGDLLAVAEPVRRVVAARLRDPHSVDDVVQETLARLLSARSRLDSSALLPYAVVTARNLAAEHGRTGLRHRQHLHRVLDLREPERPEESALRNEEQQALNAALETLDEDDRTLLVAHEVEEQDTVSLAAAVGSTPGGVAAQLARTRARLRVDYLLALHRAGLPTLRCRPVLLSLSTGDRRRQKSLRAGSHLLTCSTCAELSEPLLARRRVLAGLLPWMWIPSVAAAAHRLTRRKSVQVGTAAAAAAAVVTAGVLATRPAASPTEVAARRTPPAAAPLTPAASSAVPPPSSGAVPLPSSGAVLVAGRPLPRLGPTTALIGYVGLRVQARNVRVLTVPADEGFWVSTSRGGRLWVQLHTATGTAAESNERVRPGQRLSFGGTIVRNGPGFPGRAGVSAAEGAAQLTAQGAHVALSGRPTQG